MGKVILVVEDNQEAREELSEFFSQKGFTVLPAESGEEALGMAHLAAWVLMDFLLPGIDGVDTSIRLRKRYPVLPITMLTAFPEKKELAKSNQLKDVIWIDKKDIANELNALFSMVSAVSPLQEGNIISPSEFPGKTVLRRGIILSLSTILLSIILMILGNPLGISGISLSLFILSITIYQHWSMTGVELLSPRQLVIALIGSFGTLVSTFIAALLKVNG